MTDFDPKSPQVTQMWMNATAKDRAAIEAAHAHYSAQFAPHVDTNDNPHGVGAGLQTKVEGMVRKQLREQPRGRDVSCKKGCSACCHLPVRITREEALLIRWHLGQTRTTIDEARLAQQAATGDDLAQWAALPKQVQRCVFLKNGACSIYDRRPMACRKYMVVSPPEFCDTEKHPGHRVTIFAAPEAEIVYSAALSQFDSANMGAALLKWKGPA